PPVFSQPPARVGDFLHLPGTGGGGWKTEERHFSPRLLVQREPALEQVMKGNAIIEAAVHLIAEHGFHGVSMGMIADRAGVGTGTLYLYFESKDHLMRETYKKLERRCLAAVMEDYPSEGSVRQRFSHLSHRLIRHLMLFPEEFLFADQFLSSPYRKTVSPHYLPDAELTGMLQFFREGAAKQLFKEIPPAMLLAIACGPLIQVVRAHAAGFLYLDDDRILRTVEAAWEAVQYRNGPHQT
ncbi:MAG TPA: TetR/AcrR family transcriptional regulator, partial [Verrucomicrobiae bacterium]|nr:TetR/AcrR family transcriptional regulator [Verrucomicrobiae bacterium]